MAAGKSLSLEKNIAKRSFVVPRKMKALQGAWERNNFADAKLNLFRLCWWKNGG
ncbi:MAG: hypothetical protein PHH08_01205 [Candidatus ainarchaeum sp.]|nr:hypothetical protein [Candidatus ainarchaeum sp.]